MKPWFWRLARKARANESGHIVLNRRQIYILPTTYGVLSALLLGLMLIGSLNYANNLGFLFTFLLACLGLVTIIHTWRNLVGLQLRIAAGAPVFSGVNACFRLRLENSRPKERPGILASAQLSSIDVADLPDNSHIELKRCLPTHRRGWLQPEEITLSTTYPLGI